MRIMSFEERSPYRSMRTVLAIGFFDGLHLGHRALLASAEKMARDNQAQLLMMCFDPHPSEVLWPEHAVPLIYGLPERAYIVRQERLADEMVVIHFDRKLADTSAGDFLDALAERWNPAGVVVGEDFRFGCGNAGDSHLMAEWGKANRLTVNRFPAWLNGGTRVSASEIRNLLSDGWMKRAADLLGRPYFILSDSEWQKKGQSLEMLAVFGEKQVALPEGHYVVTVSDGTKKALAGCEIRSEGGRRECRIRIGRAENAAGFEEGKPTTFEIDFLRKMG